MGRKDGKEPWTGRRILGIAAGAVAVAAGAGAFFLLSAIGDSSSSDQQEQVEADDDPPAPPRRTMKAPGSGGKRIFRDEFEENPKLYFTTLHGKGP
ncbi:hypothetical protein U9M48_001787 [Paspalum notatum var. saurae]|uniref:Uncharacterized protein n=1 Tax=Paspalum notatum var. saurae TaxID=547442 RepID=A0AAQ3PF94_PASNO